MTAAGTIAFSENSPEKTFQERLQMEGQIFLENCLWLKAECDRLGRKAKAKLCEEYGLDPRDLTKRLNVAKAFCSRHVVAGLGAPFMLSLSQKKYEFLWDVIAQEPDLNQEVVSGYMKELRTLQNMEREAKTEVAATVSTFTDGEIIKQDVFGNRYVQSAPLYEPEDIARVQRLHNLTGKMPTTLMAMGLEALEEKLFPTELNIDLIQLTKTGIESSAPTGELLTVDIAIEKNNPVVWVSEIEPRAGIFVDRQGDKALVLEDGGGEVVVPLSSLKRIDEDAIASCIALEQTNSPEARIFQSALAVKQCAANLEVIPFQDKRASRAQLQKWHKCIHQTCAIALEEAIWIDIDALRINQLIFAPGGRDFLADVVVEGRSSM